MLTPEAEKDPVNFMWNTWKKHQKNGLMHLRSFNIDLVFVGDHETLKFLYSQPDIQLRFNPVMRGPILEERRAGGPGLPGVILSEGRTWADQRRFTLKTLRDFGFGKQGMEEMIAEEVRQFKDLINKTEGEPFDFIHELNLPILNALWMVTVGERFEYNDERLRSIVYRLTQTFARTGRPESVLVFVLPWLFKLFPSLLARDETLQVNHDMMDLMEENIVRHQETLDPNQPRDYLDTVLLEIQRTTDPTSSFYGEAGLINLRNTLFDLFLAGSETTSTTLTWAFWYMLRHPDIQVPDSRLEHCCVFNKIFKILVSSLTSAGQDTVRTGPSGWAWAGPNPGGPAQPPLHRVRHHGDPAPRKHRAQRCWTHQQPGHHCARPHHPRLHHHQPLHDGAAEGRALGGRDGVPAGEVPDGGGRGQEGRPPYPLLNRASPVPGGDSCQGRQL